MLKLVIASILLVQFALAFNFDKGQSVSDSCRSMEADTSAKLKPEKPHFDILINTTDGAMANVYKHGEKLIITLNATGVERIEQFMIQARRIDKSANTQDHVGTFKSTSDRRATQSVCERGRNNVLVDGNEVNSSPKLWKKIRLEWTPPSSLEGPIEFRVTLITDYGNYWKGEASRPIYEDGVTRPTTPEPVKTTPASYDIDAEKCGDTRGCYRHPKDCIEPFCALIASWYRDGRFIHFALSADTEGWVALGFSDDKKMGDEEVVECVYNEILEQVLVRGSQNHGDKYNEVDAHPTGKLIGQYKGKKEDGRIKCSFTKEVNAGTSDLNFENDYHLLLTEGKADKYGNKERHELEPHKYPLVSPGKVSLLETPDIHGRAKYPLVKAHGVLMLIAWMISASIAIILARYYKIMWPNKRMCGQKIWFGWHRALNLLAMICTVIGFILIFIHAGGYSKMPDLPDKAHPILGIIVTVLCILNPLIAACRCNPKHDKRPIFNWIHWFIGTIAYVLATPTLFIGLSLPKANIPWWATWVMVAFMLYHLLTELLLEIHGCINSRKQKERDMEYEYRKSSDPRMKSNKFREDPVGTRFKTVVISLYLVVVLVLGLVMIITVIVS